MSHKNIGKFRKGTKKRVSSSVIAEVVGCSPSMVRMVIRGDRNTDSTKGQQIEVAKMLLEEGMNKLVNEVKRVITI